jgi:hypothetical protein
MKAWSIIGYAYNADYHCVDCAKAAGMTKDGATDSEGSEVHPIFASDELENGACCGDCFCELSE